MPSDSGSTGSGATEHQLRLALEHEVDVASGDGFKSVAGLADDVCVMLREMLKATDAKGAPAWEVRQEAAKLWDRFMQSSHSLTAKRRAQVAEQALALFGRQGGATKTRPGLWDQKQLAAELGEKLAE